MSSGTDELRSLVKNVHGVIDHVETARKIDAGLKYDYGKAPLSLLPGQALEMIAEVFGFGAQKYARYNWTNGFHWSRLIDSSYRHLNAFNAGKDLDDESKLSHLAHLGCCVLMLLEHQARGLGVDDRYKWDRVKADNDK